MKRFQKLAIYSVILGIGVLTLDSAFKNNVRTADINKDGIPDYEINSPWRKEFFISAGTGYNHFIFNYQSNKEQTAIRKTLETRFDTYQKTQ